MLKLKKVFCKTKLAAGEAILAPDSWLLTPLTQVLCNNPMKYIQLVFLFITLLFPFQLLLANLPYKEIKWPLDDRGHLDDPQMITEWWYYAGKLTAQNENQTKHFAYYLTLRYMRDVSGRTPMLDVEVVDIDTKKVYGNSIPLTDGKISSETLGVTSRHFVLKSLEGSYLLRLKVPTADGPIDLDFTLTPLKKPLYIGADAAQRGLIDMGNQTNSFYYSITRLQTDGIIAINQKGWTVNSDDDFSCSWMDHQWGDFSIPQVLKNNPWIWIGIQLSDGTDINAGEFVSSKTGMPLGESLACISLPNGSSLYRPARIIPGMIAENGYPLNYTLQIDQYAFQLRSIVPNQNKNNVWMGVMNVNDQNVMQPNAPFAIVENTTSLQ